MLDEVTERKRAAAESAAALVSSGMVIGLGTGSTARFVVEALGRRVRDGLNILGVPTSNATATQAREQGIPLAALDNHPVLDLDIDGADEVERGSLNLTKGLGGALLREKIVASASRRVIIVADDQKLVDRLGARSKIPVETVPFGWPVVARRLEELGAAPELRRGKDGSPFRTDGGHYILDCAFGPLSDPELLASRLDATVGVVEHGLFLGITSEVHAGGAHGVTVLRR